MPEVLTKHPDVVIGVLESGGAACGDGAPQKILTECPREAFCALPGGEVCVYGVDRIGEMTQITSADLAPLVCTPSSQGCSMAGPAGAALAGVLVVGFMIALRRRRVDDRPENRISGSRGMSESTGSD